MKTVLWILVTLGLITLTGCDTAGPLLPTRDKVSEAYQQCALVGLPRGDIDNMFAGARADRQHSPNIVTTEIGVIEAECWNDCYPDYGEVDSCHQRCTPCAAAIVDAVYQP